MRSLIVAILLWAGGSGLAVPIDSTKLLIADMIVQIEATEALDAMYNFDFVESAKQFNWLRQKHPHHPLPYFVMGLNEWWKMMPDVNVKTFDTQFHFYMDTTITISEPMLENPETRIEAAFFLSAAYGFKGRLYSERGAWTKAANAGRKALKYLEISKEQSALSPELLFGDALYNYFSVWIPENYPILRPILAFFPDGDKDLGLKQFREVSNNAFYTRIEARVFLMRILASDYQDYQGALRIAEYLVQHHPDNPYFERYYMRYLYSLRRYRQMEPLARAIIMKVDSGKFGYEYTSGRYAAFFLGQMYQGGSMFDEATKYYIKAVDYGKQNGAEQTGYFLHSLLNLGVIAEAQGREKEAKKYYKAVKKYGKRKDSAYQQAKKALKDM
jgi:tetratricopeptide (TPR) repeat protein